MRCATKDALGLKWGPQVRKYVSDLVGRIRVTATFIRSDLFRYYGNTRLRTFLGALVYNRGFCFSFWFRMAKGRYPCCRSIFNGISRRFGIVIPVETKVGYGLYLGHGLPLIVNPTAVIGNNCNLSQFVTIGSNYGAAAYIGDCVYIGPSACLVENVVIGSNSIIGAGAVVVTSVPADSTVVGVPARRVGPNNHADFIGNRWPVNQNVAEAE